MSNVCPTCGQMLPGKKRELRIGALVIDQRRQAVNYDGRPLVLSRLEYRVMLAMAQRPDEPCPVDAILWEMYWDSLSNKDDPHYKVVNVYICHLRRKLTPLGIEIKNTHGRGWQIVVPMQEAA